MDSKKTELKADIVISGLEKRGLLTKEQSQEEKKDKVLYNNTRLLLKHYRTISWLLECFPDTIAAELEQPFSSLDELISRIDSEMTSGNKKLEMRIENVKKTRQLIDRVNEALMVLRKKPKDGEQLYQLLYISFIAPECLTHWEILYRLNMSSRHYYRLRDQAINILSIRLWGAISEESEFLLDLLSNLESSE